MSDHQIKRDWEPRIFGRKRTSEQEVDTGTVKWMIGAIAFALPTILLIATGVGALQDLPTSISESYILSEQEWTRDVFVGAMFALAALLLAYNGASNGDLLMSKLACLGAVILATNRCECDQLYLKHIAMSGVPHAHAVGTAMVVGALLYFCIVFFRRATQKLIMAWDNGEVGKVRYIKRRMRMYVVAGALQILAGIPFLLHEFAPRDLRSQNHGIFWAETMTLFAFAICWYTSARTNRWLAHELERKTLFRPEAQKHSGIQSGEQR